MSFSWSFRSSWVLVMPASTFLRCTLSWPSICFCWVCSLMCSYSSQSLSEGPDDLTKPSLSSSFMKSYSFKPILVRNRLVSISLGASAVFSFRLAVDLWMITLTGLLHSWDDNKRVFVYSWRSRNSASLWQFWSWLVLFLLWATRDGGWPGLTSFTASNRFFSEPKWWEADLGPAAVVALAFFCS